MKTYLFEFKSSTVFFHPECRDRKNWTMQKGTNEPKFKELNTYIGERSATAYIKIIHAERPEEFFIRKIRHVCFFDGYYCITWEPDPC